MGMIGVPSQGPRARSWLLFLVGWFFLFTGSAPAGASTVVISGGTSGIGRELVRHYLSQGWKVATFGRDPARIERLRQEFPVPDQLIVEPVHIERVEELQDFARQVRQSFGPVDALINNAGTVGTLNPIAEASGEDVRDIIQTNLVGTIELTRALAQDLRPGGTIINISSGSSRGVPGLSVYAASKGGVNSFTMSIAKEFGPAGILVFAFNPGHVDTPMQKRVRETPPEKTPFAAEMAALKEKGGLVRPEDNAAQIFYLHTHAQEFAAGTLVNYRAVQERIDLPPPPTVGLTGEEQTAARQAFEERLRSHLGTDYLARFPEVAVNGNALPAPVSAEGILVLVKAMHREISHSPGDRIELRIGTQSFTLVKKPLGEGVIGRVFEIVGAPVGTPEVLKLANPHWYGLLSTFLEEDVSGAIHELSEKERFRSPRNLEFNPYGLFARKERIQGAPLTELLLRERLLRIEWDAAGNPVARRASAEEAQDLLAHSALLADIRREIEHLLELRRKHPEVISDLGPDNLFPQFERIGSLFGDEERLAGLSLVDIGRSGARTRGWLDAARGFDDYLTIAQELTNRYIQTGFLSAENLRGILPASELPTLSISGSYDPPTRAHREMIVEAARRYGAKRVDISVNFLPHKNYNAGLAERIEMVREMLKDTNLEVSVHMRPLDGRRADLEAMAQSSWAPVVVVFGEDVLDYNIKELGGIPNVRYVMIPRTADDATSPLSRKPDAIPAGVEKLELPLNGISSTRARTALAVGQGAGEVLDENVVQLIAQRGLYQPIPPEEASLLEQLFAARFRSFLRELKLAFPRLALGRVAVPPFKATQSGAGQVDSFLQTIIQTLQLSPVEAAPLIAQGQALLQDPRSALNRRIAIYPGSFDPIRLGHREAIEAALRDGAAEVLVVARTRKPTKESAENRLELIRVGLADLGDRVRVVAEPSTGVESLVRSVTQHSGSPVTLVFGQQGFVNNLRLYRDAAVDFLVVEEKGAPSGNLVPAELAGRVRFARNVKADVITREPGFMRNGESGLDPRVSRLIRGKGMYGDPCEAAFF